MFPLAYAAPCSTKLLWWGSWAAAEHWSIQTAQSALDDIAQAMQHSWPYMHCHAGVLGQVGSSGALDHIDCSVGFRLVAPATGARILSAGLRCALLNKDAARRQPRSKGAFTADMGKLATAQPVVRIPAALLLALYIAASCSIQHVLPITWGMRHANDKAFACTDCLAAWCARLQDLLHRLDQCLGSAFLVSSEKCSQTAMLGFSSF